MNLPDENLGYWFASSVPSKNKTFDQDKNTKHQLSVWSILFLTQKCFAVNVLFKVIILDSAVEQLHKNIVSLVS